MKIWLIHTAVIGTTCLALYSCSNINRSADDPSVLSSRDFTCGELRQLVLTDGPIKLKGLISSTTVFAGPRSCTRGFQVLRSNWRTSDQFSCRVGFHC